MQGDVCAVLAGCDCRAGGHLCSAAAQGAGQANWRPHVAADAEADQGSAHCCHHGRSGALPMHPCAANVALRLDRWWVVQQKQRQPGESDKLQACPPIVPASSRLQHSSLLLRERGCTHQATLPCLAGVVCSQVWLSLSARPLALSWQHQ